MVKQFTNRRLRDTTGWNSVQSAAVVTQIVCDFIGPFTVLHIVMYNMQVEIHEMGFKNPVSSSENIE